MRICDYMEAIRGKRVNITKQSSYTNNVYEYVFGYVLTNTDYSKATIDKLFTMNKDILDLYIKYEAANTNSIKTKDAMNKVEPNRRDISSLLSALQFFNKDIIISDYVSSHITNLADMIKVESDKIYDKLKEYSAILVNIDNDKKALRQQASDIMSVLLKDIHFSSYKAFNTHCNNIYAMATFSAQILLDKLYGIYIGNTQPTCPIHHIDDSSYGKDALTNFRINLTDTSYMILDGSLFYYYVKDNKNKPYNVYKLHSFNIMNDIILNDGRDYISNADMFVMYSKLISDIKIAIYNINKW